MQKDSKSEEEPAGAEAERASSSRASRLVRLSPEATGTSAPGDRTSAISVKNEAAALEPSTSTRLTTRQGFTTTADAAATSHDRTVASAKKRNDERRSERSPASSDRRLRRSRISKAGDKSKPRRVGKVASSSSSSPPTVPAGPQQAKATVLVVSVDDPKPVASAVSSPGAVVGAAKPRYGDRRKSRRLSASEIETLTRRTYKDVATIPTAHASVSVAFVFFITAAVGSLPSNAEEKDAEKCPCQAMDQWIAVLLRRWRNGILPSMWKAESIQKLESSGAALTQSVELILDVQERFATVTNGPVADRVTSKLKAVLDKNPGFYVLKQLRSPATLVTVDEDVALKRLKRKIAIFVGAAIVAILVVLGLMVVASQRRVEPRTFCDTDDCIVHAQLLTETLNRSIDPCEDFSAYVCSAWRRTGEYSEHVKSPVDGILFARFIALRDILASGTQKLAVGRKALAMYDSCRGPQPEGKQGLADFKQLMQDIGLSWPHPPEKNVNALGVLLTASFKWQILFWMSLSVPTGNSSLPWRIDVRPGDYLPLVMNQHLNVRSVGGYVRYWKGYYQALRDNDTETAEEREIEAIANAEGYVLERLYNSLFSKKKNPAIFPLGAMGILTAPVTGETWRDQINERLHFEPKLVLRDVVLARDTGFLSALGSLFRRFNDRQLVSLFSWSFVQMYAPLFYPKLHLVRHGNKGKEELYRPIVCAFQVESSYRMLVLALEFVTRFTREDEDLVLTHLRGLTAAAVRKLRSSAWLDDESKALAEQKMNHLRTLLFPSSSFVNNSFLEDLYKDFVDEEVSFRDYWLEARLAIAKDNRTPEFEATLSLPSNIPPPIFGYNYVRNVIGAPIGIVNRPLFYNDGTNAMFYGGLGFLVALEMVRALDSVGLRFHLGGRNRKSIYSSAPEGSFEDRDSCLRDEGMESIFPEVPALEITYEALSEALKSADAKPGLPGLSEEKVFFMTICYMTCLTPGATNLFSANCHKIVRNSPAFHEAFNCSKGSKMNPTKKCSFFD
ncbi:hypothetical protein HPB50_022392 [Hyalomma asiaticum]|uniref:Uncharacterized protein n=1 Tax=Hyalomma asiaticum TaxID=266040 RepID=A0ACB7S3F8_HYAAI|nr:hypothetical protein HPB50_022392 [Hyalomma asiaticum]